MADMFVRIANALRAHGRRELPVEGLRAAAVLVPLFERDGELQLLLEQRPESLEQHAGQISFPGGMCDPEDADAVATALREAQEEIGLAAESVEVLGLLDDTATITGFRITPVVGRVPDGYPYRPNPDEVEGLITAPWSLFTNGQRRRSEGFTFQGQDYEVHYFDHQGKTIWGATARIALSLVQRVENPVPHTGEVK